MCIGMLCGYHLHVFAHALIYIHGGNVCVDIPGSVIKVLLIQSLIFVKLLVHLIARLSGLGFSAFISCSVTDTLVCACIGNISFC